jgi:hypothetical protein
LKRMDQMEATHISDVPLKANIYSWSIIWPRCTNFQVWKSRFKTYAKQCGAVNMRNLVNTRKKYVEWEPMVVNQKEVTITCAQNFGVQSVKYPWHNKCKENGGVCTSGEQPLDLTSASFWSQGSKRSPGLLAKHPLGLYMLFQKHENMMVARIKKCDVGQCQRRHT